MRRTEFERDFADLHGGEPEIIIEGEFTPRGATRYTRVAAKPQGLRWAHTMPWYVRLLLGGVALFWTLFFGALALVMIFVFGVFVWSVVNP